MSIELPATNLRGHDVSLDEPVIGITPTRLSTGLRYEPDQSRFFAEGTLHLAAGQDRLATTRGELASDGYATVDLKGGVQMMEWATVQIGVTHLLDEQYIDHLNSKNPYTGQQLPEPGGCSLPI